MKKTIIAALAVVAMAGCTKDEATNPEENLAAAFSSSIAETRVSGTSWESSDQIGIMVTSDNDLADGYQYNNRHDVTFTNAKQGTFVPASDLDQIYYSLDEDERVDFYAYYPYKSSLSASSQTYSISVTNQATPRNIDFMEASTRDDGNDGYNKNSGTVALEFSRNMAKITLTLKAGDGLALSDISAVRFSGFYTSGTYYFPTNSFRSVSGNSTSFTPYGSGSSYSAILLPRNATSHMVYFTTPNGDVPLDLSSYSLSAGRHLYFTVTVSQTEATLVSNDIIGWDEAEIEDEDATFETE